MSALAAASLVGLSGCDKLQPQAASDTMTLLRAGSEKICVAPEVQQTLRGILVPKAADVAGDGSGEDKLKAINTLSLNYELTTLQSFDKAVNRAVCNTTVRIAGAGGCRASSTSPSS